MSLTRRSKGVVLAALACLLLAVSLSVTLASGAVDTESESLSSSQPWLRRKLAQIYTSLNGYKVFESYPTDWNSVESSPTARTVQVNDVGACFCDLTSNACDTNCCCDADCSSQEKALFTGCLPESPLKPQLTYCVSKSIVQNVNLKSSGSLAVVYKSTPKKDFFSELLCVEKDNNAAFGNFFMDPGAGSSDKLTDVLTRSEYATFETSVASSQEAISYTSSFMANESIPIAFSSVSVNGTLTKPKYASLSLPVSVFGGECNEVELVGFVQNVPQDSRESTKACLRTTESLSEDCQGLPFFDPAHYTEALNVATTPAKSSYVNVTITSISSLDYSTGEIVQLSTTTPAALAYAVGAGGGTCSNVLQSLEYTIKHNGNGVISSVNAALVLMDLQADSSDASSFKQEFSVVFEKDGTTDATRGKSGNPGYRSRYPVLFGVETTDTQTQKTAVSQFTTGMPMISRNEQGVCTPQKTRTLPYGSQSMGSCKIMFTLEQLKKFCTKDNTAFAAPAGVPAYCPNKSGNAFQGDTATPLPIELLSGLFGSSTTFSGTYAGKKTYVGLWGDSDPSNVADWIEVEVESIDDSMSWIEEENTCTKVISGVQYEFLTASVGSQQNPQEKIAYARVKFTYDDWTFTNPSLDSCPQSFNVYTSSSFVEMDQEVDENVKPPAPPVFPKLPEDAFYPFLTN